MSADTSVIDQVHAALALISDPELHKPLPELGMVESVAFADGVVDLTILLTISGCPMRDRLKSDIEKGLEGIVEVK